MKIIRTAAMLGIGKKLYDEARKPHNQVKIKRAVEEMRHRVDKRRRPH